MEKGHLAIVLHAHLPFVRHPEYEDFLEERWLYEAMTETYLPLLDSLERLRDQSVPFRLSLSLTPPLVSMLTDSLLTARYVRYVEKLIELAEKETIRTRREPAFHDLARMYLERFRAARKAFVDRYGCDLVAAFRRLQDSGHLEILTSAATHAFLPLLQGYPEAVRAQVRTAVDHYSTHFGRPPRGIWLPECGYFDGLDAFLADADLRFFVLDSHGILNANPRPVLGVYAPLICPSGVAAFGRDPESSQQVWSAEVGYPGDYCYRDFYRDIGFDLDFEYVRPYVDPAGTRCMTGIKYHRITGRTDRKEPYDPRIARERAASHASHFLSCRERQIEHLRTVLGGRKPLIVAPYDAELFGHWWFEGPEWLEILIRKIAYDQRTFRLTHLAEYLTESSTHQLSSPGPSSWGMKGYNEVWLEPSNAWIYRHEMRATERMTELADRFTACPDPLVQRALKQAGREVLLAQSSDWAFILKTGTAVGYARKRLREHILRFLKLDGGIRARRIDERSLAKTESKDNIFPGLNPEHFASRGAP